MLPLPPFLVPDAIAARALNPLLKREHWARDRLARYAGKTVRFVVGRVSLGLTLQATGYVEAANPVIVPDVTLTLTQDRLGELPAVLRTRDPALIAGIMHVQGDAGLAQLVSDLARDLRWDIEDDLSAVVGDVAAMRLLGMARKAFDGTQAVGRRLAANVTEYLAYESDMLLNRPTYVEWLADMQSMLKRLDALETQLAPVSPPRSHGA